MKDEALTFSIDFVEPLWRFTCGDPSGISFAELAFDFVELTFLHWLRRTLRVS